MLKWHFKCAEASGYYIATDKRGYPHNIFLISPQHMFLWRNKKDICTFWMTKGALSVAMYLLPNSNGADEAFLLVFFFHAFTVGIQLILLLWNLLCVHIWFGWQGKKTYRWYFSYFSQKTVHDISCKLPPSIGDNLYEMSKPLFRDKLEKYFNMSSAENFYPEC